MTTPLDVMTCCAKADDTCMEKLRGNYLDTNEIVYVGKAKEEDKTVAIVTGAVSIGIGVRQCHPALPHPYLSVRAIKNSNPLPPSLGTIKDSKPPLPFCLCLHAPSAVGMIDENNLHTC